MYRISKLFPPKGRINSLSIRVLAPPSRFSGSALTWHYIGLPQNIKISTSTSEFTKELLEHEWFKICKVISEKIAKTKYEVVSQKQLNYDSQHPEGRIKNAFFTVVNCHKILTNSSCLSHTQNYNSMTPKKYHKWFCH